MSGFASVNIFSKNTNVHIYKRIVKSLAMVMRERKASSHHSSDIRGENPRYSLERLEVGTNGVWRDDKQGTEEEPHRFFVTFLLFSSPTFLP